MESFHSARGGAISFGVFEVDLRAGELRKQGVKIKLQDQPFQVLQILLEKPGEVVTRDDLQSRIWSADTFVDFDHGIANAIKRLREALGDSADNPQFIETLPRKGYRWIAAVNGNGFAHHSPVETIPSEVVPLPAPPKGRPAWYYAAPLMLLPIFLLAGIWLGARFPQIAQSLGLRSGSPKIHSIAVLSLKDLSDVKSQEYFAYGMTDELITALSQVSALKVISHTSATRYDKTDKTVPQIAQELGADGVVEGTVQRVGDRVRVSVQLINASQDAHIWAQNYERDVRDVFGLESEVAQAIAQEVRARLTPREQDRLAKTRSMNLAAVESYLQAQYHSQRADRAKFKRGMESTVEEERKVAFDLYQKALAADPGFAPAYVGLAYSYSPIFSTKRDVPKTMAALKKAIELDPQLADAHWVLGDANMVYQWDWANAESEYKRAIELNGNLPQAHDSYGYFLDAMGRMDEGLAEHQKAEQLEPGLDHMSGAFFNRHDFERAIAFEKTNEQLDPEWFGHHWFLGVFQERSGNENEAAAEFQRVMVALNDDDTAIKFRQEYEKYGLRPALHLYAVHLEPMARKDEIPPFALIYLYGAAGDTDRAFAWLEKAYQLRGDEMVNLKVSPYFDALRSDPRFADYIRRVGLPQ
jgi:TolB-like protein/DNA-binding winged helix-turn-helix (wHTH) protein/Tfp pilus assembly protein PilF